jgi:integrase
MWIIPPERMKAHREHRVPLSDRAIEILESLPREGEFVFIGSKASQPLSNMALLMTLRRMGRGDLTAHGFRSTFKDWATETTAYPVELSEMALAAASHGRCLTAALSESNRNDDWGPLRIN